MLLIITTRLTNENNRYDIGDTITTSPTNKTTLLLIYKFINMSVGKYKIKQMQQVCLNDYMTV